MYQWVFLFPTNQPEVNICSNPECHQQRYKNFEQVEAEKNSTDRDSNMPLPVLVPHRQISYTSIKQALTELYANDDNLDMLQYGYDSMKEDLDNNSSYKDIFSGKNFRHLLNRKIIHPNTICLILFVDVYQHKNMQKAHQVLINCLVMNIHHEHR